MTHGSETFDEIAYRVTQSVGVARGILAPFLTLATAPARLVGKALPSRVSVRFPPGHGRSAAPRRGWARWALAILKWTLIVIFWMALVPTLCALGLVLVVSIGPIWGTLLLARWLVFKTEYWAMGLLILFVLALVLHHLYCLLQGWLEAGWR